MQFDYNYIKHVSFSLIIVFFSTCNHVGMYMIARYAVMTPDATSSTASALQNILAFGSILNKQLFTSDNYNL